jgi:hypothetical protein
MGVSLIALILVLIIGPMFLFSTAFTAFGSVNPAQTVQLNLDLEITDFNGVKNIN